MKGIDSSTQAAAREHFVVYQTSLYKQFLNVNVSKLVFESVKDTLAEVRNYDYLSFKSNMTTSYSVNMISTTRN